MKKLKSKAFWVGHCAGSGIFLSKSKLKFDENKLLIESSFCFSYYPEEEDFLYLKLKPGEQKKFRLVEVK